MNNLQQFILLNHYKDILIEKVSGNFLKTQSMYDFQKLLDDLGLNKYRVRIENAIIEERSKIWYTNLRNEVY